MGKGIHFIGAGDFGCRVSRKLSEIYEDTRAELIHKSGNASPQHLGIHVFPFAETACLDGKDHFIILAGSVHDPCWMEARKALHESMPYLMVTIGIDHERGICPETFQPFPDECLVFPGPSLFDPFEVAQLVLQIFFIHTPWNMSSRGSLIGYDLADTKQIFAGKITKIRKMSSDKEHYRQNYSKFLTANKTDLSRAQGILMTFWGRDDVLSIPKANELWEEMKRFVMPDAHQAFTFHILPEGETEFMATLFLNLKSDMIKPFLPKELHLKTDMIRVATVVVASNGNYDNRSRLALMRDVVREAAGTADVLLFPAGYYTTKGRPSTRLETITEQTRDMIKLAKHKLIVCFGIDGRDTKDQIAVAVGSRGVLAIGRKFQPTAEEVDFIDVATDPFIGEGQHPRMFTISGKRAFLAVCYDGFGIRQRSLNNPGIDFVLNLVHKFNPKGESSSGEVYFAKYGFAGASKEWSCPTFGAAVFFNRPLPRRWPTGVLWNQGKKEVKSWKYTDNPLEPSQEFEVDNATEKALVRVYHL